MSVRKGEHRRSAVDEEALEILTSSMAAQMAEAEADVRLLYLSRRQERLWRDDRDVFGMPMNTG
jgi:hypothetical protein